MYVYIYLLYVLHGIASGFCGKTAATAISIILCKLLLFFFFLLQKQQKNNITYCTVRIHHPPSTCVQDNATVATAGPARPVYTDTEKNRKNPMLCINCVYIITERHNIIGCGVIVLLSIWLMDFVFFCLQRVSPFVRKFLDYR